jgi:phage terminase large subunit GpA-like protein
MVEMPDRPAGSRADLGPMPPHASAADVLRAALPSLNPATRMGVVDAAEKHMKVNANGRWVSFDRAVTPYMVEPANVITSRRYRELIFVGPARTGKTVMLLQGVAHLITCDPGVCHITHMTAQTAEAWVDEELLPMIENSPEVAARQGKGRSDRNILSKKFIGGAKLTIGPPTKANLSGRTIRLVMFTDLDRMTLNIGGEGSPFLMGAKRNETLGSRGMTVAEASPGHLINNPGWKPGTPHEAAPCDGILDLYNGGTRAHWYWDCPDCGDPFEVHFKYLDYDKTLLPAEAGESAVMLCPNNGCVIDHVRKPELNRAGYWLHETAAGDLARLASGDVLKSDRVSYHLNGAAAAFASWARIVAKYETALRSLKITGDESPLQVTINTDQGMPYLPRALSADGGLTVDDLRAGCKVMAKGIAPEWARFVIVTVDVQKNRFDVQVTAYGIDGRRGMIDRFDLHTPPGAAPSAADRILDPAKYAEDWDVLLPLMQVVYPVDGQEYGLRPMALGCDFHGAPGVSDNATKFWQARRKDGEASRWFMIRGHGGLRVEGRHWYKAPTRASDGRQARDIKLLNIATDKFKDTVFAGLSRTDGGPGSFTLGQWLPDARLKEFTAERRGEKGWVTIPNIPRNESIDLSSYAQAVAEHKGLLKLDPARPHPWALGGLENPHAVALAGPDDVARAQEKPARRTAHRRMSYLE